MLTVTLAILTSLVLFTSVTLLIYALFSVPVNVDRTPIQRRVAAAVGSEQEVSVFDHPVFGLPLRWSLGFAEQMQVLPLRERIRQDLDTSGNASGYTIDEYLAICLLTGLSLGGSVALLDVLAGGQLVFFTGPIALAAGFALPIVALRSSAKRRQLRIAKQLPYTLDLIGLTMAAGSSFNEAIRVLIRDQPNDDLNQELQLALAEMELGATRTKALSNMAERVPLDTLRSIVAAINQGEDLGTPLSGILKTQAEMLRVQRSVRAEKLAASASLRILLPTMLILIGVVILIFSPFVLRWSQGGLF